MLKEAKKLYDLGFAIHWLKPKSKSPIETGWTKGPRKAWEELEASYRIGMNMGVRLGAASAIDGAYLAVVDVDIKSRDPKHREEAQAKFLELFKGSLQQSPRVVSGRGNGSGHVYCISRTPVSPKRLAQSSEKVPVYMPSIQPSKADEKALNSTELASGMRMRAAWEISLMGEGQQVVLPPSVHPDSGKLYRWSTKEELSQAHFAWLSDSFAVGEDLVPKKVESSLYKPVLLHKPISAYVQSLIDGENSTNRSDELLFAAGQMVKEGFSDAEILSALSEKDTFLGQAAWERRGTRESAMDWLAKYTLPKAHKDYDPKVGFEVIPKEEVDKMLASDWKMDLKRTEKGGVKLTLFNQIKIIESAAPGPVFKHDEFSNRPFYGADVPWGKKAGDPVKDIDMILLSEWAGRMYDIHIEARHYLNALKFVAYKNSFHPVKEYLNSLTWDGIPRINTWLKDYCQADMPEPYLSAVSRKVLCAMVARVFEPGIKFDTVLVLEGGQGKKKSSVGLILASADWFLDSLPDIHDKDARLNLQGAWIVEMAELASLKRTDTESYKSFFSTQKDRVRSPYGVLWEDYKRQNIFMGTTNESDYLKDKTGNRRILPVKIKETDIDALSRDRNQLFAEAKFVWELGETLYLSQEEEASASPVRDSRIAEDEETHMEHEFLDFFMAESEKKVRPFDFEKFKLEALFKIDFGPLQQWNRDKYSRQIAGRFLHRWGFENYKNGGYRFWRSTPAAYEMLEKAKSSKKEGVTGTPS